MKSSDSFMSRLARSIVKGRWVIFTLFAAMIVFSCFSVRWIETENDLTAYLPDDAEARKGLAIMNDEFVTYGTASVMVRNLSPERARELADSIAMLEDVALVSYDGSDDSYRDGAALFSVTFADVTKSPRAEAALEAVRALLADEDVTIHSDVGFSLSVLLADQMLTVSIFVVLVVLAVLLFTSSTYAEIPVMILTFLTAAVINLGTHFLLGKISFVSNSVGAVLQLALSVDYAIIFCNRYKEEHERYGIREAVERALKAAIPEIFASSLTTIAGLTAMTFMKFRLGVDLGFTLVKSIICSLLTVFFFMPCLLLLFGKAMDKTRHRPFVPKISFIGKFAYATRFVFPILFAALVACAYLVFGKIDYCYSMYAMRSSRQTEYEASKYAIDDVFGEDNLVAMLVPAGDYPAEQALLAELSARPEIKSATGLASIEAVDGRRLGDLVSSADFSALAGVDETSARAVFAYYAAAKGEHQRVLEDPEGYRAPLVDLFLFLRERVEAGDVDLEPAQREQIESLYGQLRFAKNQLQGEHYSRLVLSLKLPIDAEETFAFLDELHHIAGRYIEGETVLTGNSVSALGFKDSFATDNLTVGLMSLVLVMLILFFTFKSFGMPLLLILVIQGSIWMNFAIAALQGTQIFFMCYLIVSAVQMGANIDYAIVVSSRYTELRETRGRRESIIETLNLAFPTIITSGLMMVCAGLLVGFQVSQCIIAGMGYYIGTGTSISLCLILFALPQLLLLGDRFVAVTRVRPENSVVWAYVARNRRRVASGFLAAAALLALLAAPFALRSGAEYDDAAEDYAALLLAETRRLSAIAQRVEKSRGDSALAYGFAEQLLTDEIGSTQLAEGEAQYEEGLATYEVGKAQYDAGAAKLADARAQYNAGAAQLAEGQARYDAGLAQYEAGKAQYAAAQQQLAEGQAQYDAGLAEYSAAQQQLAEGQARYDAGLAEYNSAKASFDAVSPLFQNALALQAEYQNAQSRYDQAVAEGDMITALSLAGPLAAARFAFEATGFNSLLGQYQAAEAELSAAEAELSAGKAALDAGYAELAAAEQQLAEGKAKLDEGYAQLPAAEQELAAAEAELAAGKAALDAGYAELYAGGAQIDAGQTALDSAGEELEEGKARLDEAADQLEEGREQLAQNKEELQNSLAALDALHDDEAVLAQGLELLRGEAVLASIPRNAGALDTLAAARDALEDYLSAALKLRRNALFVALDLGLAALLGLLALLFTRRHALLCARLAAFSALLAAAGLLFWFRRCQALTPWLLLPPALLALTAALFAELLFRQHRQTAPPPAAGPAAETPSFISAADYSEILARLEPEQLEAVLKAFFQSEEYKKAAEKQVRKR